MYKEFVLSNVTMDYINQFYSILSTMKEKMTGADLTDSISGNFIVQMIPHHMAAIEMSENILKYTTFIPIQEIAQGIITEQTKSIENMRSIERECSGCINSERELCLYQNKVDMIMRTMFEGMKNAAVTNNINADFMREMIPHHCGAVEMSRNALKYDICSGLHPILDAIIASQQRGIIQMRRLLRDMNC